MQRGSNWYGRYPFESQIQIPETRFFTTVTGIKMKEMELLGGVTG